MFGNMTNDTEFMQEAILAQIQEDYQDAHDALNEMTTDGLATLANACSTIEMLVEQILHTRSLLDDQDNRT